LTKKTQFVISSDMNSNGFHGGSLTTTFSQLHKVKHTSKAQLLAETNHELASMLVNRPLQQKGDELDKMDVLRRRKVLRMQGVRETAGEENKVPFTYSVSFVLYCSVGLPKCPGHEYFPGVNPTSSVSSSISKGQGYRGFLRKRAGSSFGQKRAICIVKGKT
jgi:hypothetical protein